MSGCREAELIRTWPWLLWSGCVVGVDQHVTIDEPVDEIRVHAVNADVTVTGRPGSVTVDGAIGGAANGAPSLVVGDGVLTLDVDCRTCGGHLEIGAPPEVALLVKVEHGGIDVRSMAGPTDLSVDLGDLEVHDHAGPLVTSGGTGSQDLALIDPISLDAAQEVGRVTVTLPAGGYALDLVRGGGEPSVDPAVVDDPDGPPVKVRADQGKLEIRAAP